MTIALQAPPEHQIFIRHREGTLHPKETHLLRTIRSFLKHEVEQLQLFEVYTLRMEVDDKTLELLANEVFIDPLLQESYLDISPFVEADWVIEIGYKEGVTDNAANVARQVVEDYFQRPFSHLEKIRYSKLTFLNGNLSHADVEQIAYHLLGNPLIENIAFRKLFSELPVEIISLEVSDSELMTLSKKRCLALNLEEMKAIQAYFCSPDVQSARNVKGLPSQPTDVELESLAQTWSEHCKHKIFNAEIRFKDGTIVNSLFKTYIEKATQELQETCPWLVSVFKDNAGIIQFNEEFNLAFKVETHNSPSALDPYGGALTGILGVNRDILGAGAGARLMANTDVFCFAPLNYTGPLPPRLQHPKRIFEGVRLGVEHGGNKSGIPTVNGALFFHERYLGKPVVYCGSVGIMPASIGDKATHEKEILPGDLIVIAGGKTGKDGIHGATFSSEELHEKSPTSAVQIGDPFTQKKLHDFIIEARDASLFRTLTDNGAGGFSSSVGELAELSNGCEIHLDQAPLKANQIQPWEIFVSESQERMTLAVDPNHLNALKTLAALHEVEIAAIGTFTDSGYLHCFWNDQTIAYLDLDFLHNGVPQLKLEAEITQYQPKPLPTVDSIDYTEILHRLLGSLNVCSREGVVRQYDHEIQGGTILKPCTGVHLDAPSDAAVLWPLESMQTNSLLGIAVANGLCPRLSDGDCYQMASCAVDEAVRNLISVGTDPKSIAVLDNFCWPDPIYDPVKTPDGKHKLAQLVCANQGLYDACMAYKTPIISGKDSMKNDYKIGETKISIPPTLLISAIGKIPNIELVVSMDFKEAGDALYLLGETTAALAFSEYAFLEGFSGGELPKINLLVAKRIYDRIYEAIQKKQVSSCHDLSEGGLAVALCESAFGGDLGANIALDFCSLEPRVTLFSESPSRLLVSIPQNEVGHFEQLFVDLPCNRIGEVTKNKEIIVKSRGKTLLNEHLDTLKKSWKEGELL